MLSVFRKICIFLIKADRPTLESEQYEFPRLIYMYLTELDGIPSRSVKDAAPIILAPLTHVINIYTIQGSVSGGLKSAFKKTD